MGCVYNRGTKANPNYWIRWRENGVNRFQQIGPDKALAKATMAQIEGNRQKKKLSRRLGVETEPLPPAPLFDTAADDWIKMRSTIGADGHPAFRAWRDDRGRLKNHLRPRLGSRHLDEITVDDVLAVIEKMRPTHAPQTIRNVTHTLSRLYEDQPKAMRLLNPVRELERADRKRIG